MTYDTEQIRQDFPIYDIVSQALPLKKAGNEYKACCPFHDDRTPSFHVIPHKQFAHCHGCGWSGDVIKFIMDYKRIDFIAAMQMLVGDDPASVEQSPEAKAEREAALEKRRKEEERDRQRATQKARDIWDSASPADPHHPYLIRKQVQGHTVRQSDDGFLILPVFSQDGEIQSIQKINDRGDKLFQPGAPMASGRMMIGINMGRSILCEGYATGASIYEAIPDQICVTFSMGNMEKVAREMAAEGRSCILAADTGTSAERMTKLGQELGFPVVVPTVPTDFNDMASEQGVDAVADLFRATLRDYADRAARIEDARKEDTGPVDLWATYEPPQLPRGMLPPLIERYAFESAEQMGVDPSGLAMSALAACSAVIRDDIHLKPKQHEEWTESARIWVMLVGNPSSRKSPMMKRSTKAIKRMDAQMLRDANKAMADWQEDGGQKGSTPRPPMPRLRIEDATTEAAQEVCKESPNGILVLQDELQGLFGRIEKYGGGKSAGGDRSFWLQAYGGGQYAVNRVGRGSFLIDNLSVTMLGGIQPDTIRRIMHDSTDDGLIQRFMPVVLRRAEMDRDVETSPVSAEFDALIEALHGMEPPSNFFGQKPLTFSEDARSVREELVARNYRAAEHMEGFNMKLATHIGKHDGLFPRLCVIWHCVENVGRTGDDFPTEISQDTAARVSAFLTDFALPHAVAFYTSTIGLADGQEVMRDVGGHILAHKKETVSLRDIVRAVRAMRNMKPDEQLHVMENMEAFGWLERADKRRDAASWKVLPEVHGMFAVRAENERNRRANIRLSIAEIAAGKSA